MHEQEPSTDTLSQSRSTSPDSTLASSLFDATANIDDLTNTLANFSRVATPEPAAALTCCCARDDCEHLKAWQGLKSKLESRLILSAEVGQALLQRHESYVRRVESRRREHRRSKSAAAAIDTIPSERIPSTKEELEVRVAELMKENAALEKRFNQALLNSEVAESSNKTMALELQEVRNAVSRLSTEHARSVGWETRMRNLMQERDDLQQERDNEAQKVKMMEARLAALNDKCALLRTQVTHLQTDLEQQRQHRVELSEEILQDARSRLQELSFSRRGDTSMAGQDEVTKVMETLVADNESLMKSNAELQRMLAESRESVNSLQEEAEEYRASLRTSMIRDDAGSVRHRHTLSNQSLASNLQMSSSSQPPPGTASGPNSPSTSSFYPLHRKQQSSVSRRPASTEPANRRRYEPLTPETAHHPLLLSPDHSVLPSKNGSRTQPPSPLHGAFDFTGEDDTTDKPRGQKPLLLLTRSRGVQTDQWIGLLSPLPSNFDHTSSSTSPHEGQSESSSLAENPSTLSVLLERISVLFNRLSQADALTLTNRLKRQHLIGADVSHLSRTTVDAIIADVNNLRAQFRSVLEDEKIVTTCTRKDLRTLFKILREVFQEMGSMRVTLNDVVLDPSLAPRIREIAFNPSAEETNPRNERDNAADSNVPGWMAPLTKLFGTPAAPKEKGPSPIVRSNSRSQAPSRSTKLVPKIAPAASASTTTVNVEFSGTGLGRAVTSTSTAVETQTSVPALAAPRPQPAMGSRKASSNVMGIFRGAPTPSDSSSDPWVVIPSRRAKTPGGTLRGLRMPEAAALAALSNAGELSPTHRNMARMSMNVNAMLDQQEGTDHNATLRRTLRPRGLSDSSIHTTYKAHAVPEADESTNGSEGQITDFAESSVLQTLSRKVQDFKTAAANSLSGGSTPFGASPPVPSHIRNMSSGSGGTPSPLPRSRSPRQTGILPDMTSWAIAGQALDRPDSERPFIGSPRTRENTREYLGRPL